MNISIYELAALGAAIAWALGSLISTTAVKHIGTMGFNRYRLVITSAMLGLAIIATGGWVQFNWSYTSVILVSGFIGIFMGDTALFGCMRRLGARRASILFAMNAPITAILGFLILDERLSFTETSGIILAIIGVAIAIAFGKRKSQLTQWDEIIPPLSVGIMLGLLAALGQSVGSIIIRPVMVSGADPIVTALLRVAISGLALVVVGFAVPSAVRSHHPMTPRIWYMVILSAFLGMGLGMTLIMFAFTGAPAGIVATLSATTPVMVLPMLWWQNKEIPALGAWAGAILVVIGSGLIFVG